MGSLNLVRLLVTRAAATTQHPPVGSVVGDKAGGEAGSTAGGTAGGDVGGDSDISRARLRLHSSLPSEVVSKLRREVLEPLDKWLRDRMDVLHVEISDQRTPRASDSLAQMRVSFTHLHVATDVTSRTIELCAAFHAGAAVAIS